MPIRRSRILGYSPLGLGSPWTLQTLYREGAAELQSGLPWVCSCPLRPLPGGPTSDPHPPRYKSPRTHELPLMDSTHGPVHNSHQTCALGSGQPHHCTRVTLHAGPAHCKALWPPELSPGCSCCYSPASLAQPRPRLSWQTPRRERVYGHTISSPSQLPLRTVPGRADSSPDNTVRAVCCTHAAPRQGLIGCRSDPSVQALPCRS